MIYLAMGLSAFLTARGLHRGELTTAKMGAVLLVLSEALAVWGG
jgi:hypothetical protein